MTFPEDETPSEPPASMPMEDAANGALPEDDRPQEPVAAPEPEPEFDFPRMDEDLAAFRRELDEIRFNAPTRSVDDEPVIPVMPAARRRRRSSRLLDKPDASELVDRLESIIQRATPTFDFFIFSFLAGCILAVGYILDAPAILLIGVLVAPLLAPWVGFCLSIASGEIKLFGQGLGGMLTALLTVFVLGLLGGFASRIFQPLTSSQAFYHAHLWWPDLLMLIIGTVILVFAFIQSEEKPLVASMMVAYEIYLPAGAAGFGLGSGVEGLWPQAGLVLIVHLALSLIVGLIVFFYMGFRPVEVSGYVLAAAGIITGLVVLASFAGAGGLVNVRGEQPPANPNPAASFTPQPVASAAPASQTPLPPTSSPTPPPTVTPSVGTPTQTGTPEPTLLPTPVYGKVQSKSGGVAVRVKPGGAIIKTVLNGYLVEILADKPIILAGATWVHVIIKTPSGDIDGWVLLDLISTATPSGSP